MKITLKRGTVIVEAETKEECWGLVEYALEKNKDVADIKNAIPSKRKQKRHLFKMKCELCGRACKGRQGLGQHRRRHHAKEGLIPAKLNRNQPYFVEGGDYAGKRDLITATN